MAVEKLGVKTSRSPCRAGGAYLHHGYIRHQGPDHGGNRVIHRSSTVRGGFLRAAIRSSASSRYPYSHRCLPVVRSTPIMAPVSVGHTTISFATSSGAARSLCQIGKRASARSNSVWHESSLG